MVLDEKGAPLPGANIVALHTPSGSKYGVGSNKDGRFNLLNMAVGGPYKITVSFMGYTDKVIEDVYLSLGNVVDFKVQMSPSAHQLDEFKVVAVKSDLLNSDRTGAATSINNETVNSVPTMSRGLRDFTKISPLANISGSGTSFAGVSNRYNQFAIDGLISNDVFGLTSSGTNGGQAGIEPISLDAIEEFQIGISPYDVRQSGFTGGGINAVTKSGTNQIKGSVYYYTNNQNTIGSNNASTESKSKYPKYTDMQTGITMGGPIIKNKLFFFINGEITKTLTPLDCQPGTSASNITVDEVNRVLAVLNRIAPNYNPGAYGSMNNETNSKKLLAKINWNINDKNKLILRHSYTYGENISNSRSANALRLYNNGIFFPSTTNSSGLELNSSIGNNISNKLSIGYTRVRDNRDPLGDPFPSVTVNIGSSRTITLGSEYSSVANQLDQDNFTFTNDFSIFLGKHNLTFGTHDELYKFYNLFVQNIYGNYAYDSLASFEKIGTANEVAPIYYAVGYSFDANDNPSQSNGAAKFKAMQLGFYTQDEFNATENLKLTMGLRVDVPIFPDKPGANEDFNNYYDSCGVATGQMPKSNILWSPRIGFNWDVLKDKSLQVRGGTGLFTGRVPFVWLSNQFSNNGQLNGTYSTGSTSGTTRLSAPVKFTADPYNQPTAESLGKTAGKGAINVVDPNLKFPQIWRTNLAIDKKLPWGVVATIEGIYSKDFNDINFINLNRQVDNSFTFEGIDNRPRYTASSTSPTKSGYNSSARINSSYDEIIQFENTNKGYSYNFVAQLQKQAEKGFSGMVAYTYGHSEDVNSGTSSVAYSNWRYVNNYKGLNNLPQSTSNYDLGSRIIGMVSYRKEYARGLMSSQISLFYTGQSGVPLSYIYYGDLNNDGTTNDLIFIPKTIDDINLISYTKTVDGTKVTVTPDEQWANLNSYIEGDKYLKKHRGGYAKRNAARLPFQNQFDLKFIQEFKIDAGKTSNRIQMSFDILNVGNLINKDWGHQDYVSNNQCTLITYKGLQNTATTGYSYTNKPTFIYDGSGLSNGKPYSVSDLSSRWRMQIGLRYIFN